MLNPKFKKISLSIIVIGVITFAIRSGTSVIKNASFPKPFFTFVDLLIASEPDNYIDIYGRHIVGQVYIPKYSNLCRIGFFILKEKEKRGNLIFHLKSCIDAQDDIVTLTVKGTDLYNNYYPFKLPPLTTPKGSLYFFEFKPRGDLVGKPLYFYLESPDSEPYNAIKVGYWKNIFRRGNAGGSSYHDGVVWDGYLAFESYYWWDGNLVNVGREIFKRLMRDRNFTISHFILCLVLLVAIFTVDRRLKLAKR